jgi:hypothetical protein
VITTKTQKLKGVGLKKSIISVPTFKHSINCVLVERIDLNN